MYNYLSAIINLPQCTYFAQSTGFAQMNVSFTDKTDKEWQKKRECWKGRAVWRWNRALTYTFNQTLFSCFRRKMSKLLLCICGPRIVFLKYLSGGTDSNGLYKGSVWMRLFVTQIEKVQDVVKKKVRRMLHVLKCLWEENGWSNMYFKYIYNSNVHSL